MEVSVTVDEAGYRSNKMTGSLDYFIKKFNFYDEFKNEYSEEFWDEDSRVRNTSLTSCINTIRKLLLLRISCLFLYGNFITNGVKLTYKDQSGGHRR